MEVKSKQIQTFLVTTEDESFVLLILLQQVAQ